MPESAQRPRVALLGRDDEVRKQLHAALVELGADIVFTGALRGADAAPIAAAAPQVLIINLEADSDDGLDAIDTLMMRDDINFIFNEAETTRQLAGWDLARWARHLAAKILGRRDTTPPPPQGAELVPSRDLQLDETPMVNTTPVPKPETFAAITAEGRSIQDAVPSSRLMSPVVAKTSSEADENLGEMSNAADLSEVGIDLGEIASAMTGGASAEPLAMASASPQQLDRPSQSEVPTIALDLGDIEASLAQLGQSMPVTKGPVSKATAVAEPSVEFDLGEIEASLAGIGPTSLDSQHRRPPSLADSRDVMDLGALDLMPLEPDSKSAAGVVDLAVSNGDLGAATDLPSIDFGGMEPLELPGQAPSLRLEGLETDGLNDGPLTAISMEGLEDLGGLDFDDGRAPVRGVSLRTDATEFDSLDHGDDADVAALAAQLDALDSATPQRDGAAKGLDFSLLEDVAKQPEAVAEVRQGASRTSPAVAAGMPAASVKTGGTASQSAKGESARPATPAREAPRKIEPRTGSGSAFGDLELAPISEDPKVLGSSPKKVDASVRDFSNLSLSLQPLAGEPPPLAPIRPNPPRPKPTGLQQSAGAVESPAAPPSRPASVELKLLDEPVVTGSPASGIGRLIVLGASIGGPDALRTFLGGIPAEFPALFLIAQHLENGFFSRLAAQLQKASKLQIRVAGEGVESATRSQVLIVPSDARYRIGRSGKVEVQPHTAPQHYKPCIDDLFRAAADEFGSRVTAIIFSGMAGDAIEGAVYVTAKGGEVWVQDPQSCVVSSMVDGAKARGVVEFSGSPRELAEQCVVRYGQRG